MRLSRRSWMVLPLLAATAVRADGLSVGEQYVRAAREVLGVRYQFGGRMRSADEGIDCQGVLFYAAERVGGCGWKSFSVYPTTSVARGELGLPVEGLNPVSTAALDERLLRPGDVLLLVGFDENPAEPSIARLDDRPVWVWHTGVYSGNGRWIVGDHYAGRVVETPLRQYLSDHADVYAGVFVTRLKGAPSPERCRTHPPMKLPGKGRARLWWR